MHTAIGTHDIFLQCEHICFAKWTIIFSNLRNTKTSLMLQVENNIRWLEQHKEVIHMWLETRGSWSYISVYFRFARYTHMFKIHKEAMTMFDGNDWYNLPVMLVEDDQKSMWNLSAATTQKCTPMLGNKTILPKFSIFCVNSTASRYSCLYNFKSFIVLPSPLLQSPFE